MNEHLDEETINLFLDRMLDKAERQVVESHLVMCADCRADLARWQALFVTLDSLAPMAEQPALDFASAVLSRVRLLPTPRERRVWPWVAAQGVAALVLLMWAWPQAATWAETAPSWAWRNMAEMARGLSSIGLLLAQWARAVQYAVRSLWATPLPSPVADLTLTQWILILIGLLVFWLLANRRLLQNGFQRRS